MNECWILLISSFIKSHCFKQGLLSFDVPWQRFGLSILADQNTNTEQISEVSTLVRAERRRREDTDCCLMTRGDAKRRTLYVTKQPPKYWPPPPLFWFGGTLISDFKTLTDNTQSEGVLYFSIVKHTHFCWDFFFFFILNLVAEGNMIVPKQRYLECGVIKEPILSPADVTRRQIHWYLRRRTSSPYFNIGGIWGQGHSASSASASHRGSLTSALQSIHRFFRQGPIL